MNIQIKPGDTFVGKGGGAGFWTVMQVYETFVIARCGDGSTRSFFFDQIELRLKQ